ncbi:hypothetical protein [Sphingobium aromaticiconvertens]
MTTDIDDLSQGCTRRMVEMSENVTASPRPSGMLDLISINDDGMG